MTPEEESGRDPAIRFALPPVFLLCHALQRSPCRPEEGGGM